MVGASAPIDWTYWRGCDLRLYGISHEDVQDDAREGFFDEESLVVAPRPVLGAQRGEWVNFERRLASDRLRAISRRFSGRPDPPLQLLPFALGALNIGDRPVAVSSVPARAIFNADVTPAS